MASTAVGGDHRLGFETQANEIENEAASIEGRLPGWLSGTLLRTGPALFEVDGRPLNHAFDGMAMLHRFSISNSKVSYGCRFLRSKAYQAATNGRLAYREFATDPCRALYREVAASYTPATLTDNGTISVQPFGGELIAMNETPMPLIFNPQTLETLGVAYEPPGYHCTAHPHQDLGAGELIGFAIAMGREPAYRIYGQQGREHQRLLAEIEVDQPAYMHTFGMAEHHFVLMEAPLVTDPVDAVEADRPFIENYRWEPERGFRLVVVDRSDGRMVGRHTTDACFCFHQINVYQEGDELVLDLCVFDDARIIEAFYLERLRSGEPPRVLPLPWRYRIPLDDGEVSRELIAPQALELPRINYCLNGRRYRYAYGVGIAGSENPSGWLDQIVKLDVDGGEHLFWHEAGVFPGEPVFVARPGAQAEDDGVLLSVTLDPSTATSFLLVLDARDLSELARARVSQHIPWHFHGHFDRNPQATADEGHRHGVLD